VIRILARAVLSLLANAVALVVAALLLSKVSLSVGGFVIAVVVFTVTAIVVEPLLRQTAVRNAPAILGSTALIATLISLIVTVIVTDGLRISGSLTWVLATVIVWVIAMVARLFLPLLVFKQILADDRSPNARA